MAPVGKTIPHGNGYLSKGENGHNNEIDEDAKLYNEGIFIKSEEEEEPDSYAAMNGDEGVVIKTEEISDDEYQQSDEDISDDIKSENEGGNDRASSQGGDTTEEPGKPLLCKVCGKQFTRVFYFNLHVKTHDISIANNPTKPHKCLECGKTFALLQHLTGHSRTHIANRYFECPICRRKFTELSNLTMHLLKTHPDEKPYKCSDCDKQFTQSSALKKHMRTHSSVTSQEEIDRIDMLFYVENCSERDIDEPLRKKIKLEKDDEKISPSKEKLKENGRKDDRSPSSKGKSPSMKEKSVSPKRRSPAKIKACQLKEKAALGEHPVVEIKEEVSSESEQVVSSEAVSGIPTPQEKVPSQSKNNYLSPTSSPTFKTSSPNNDLSNLHYDVSAAIVSPRLSASVVDSEKDIMANDSSSSISSSSQEDSAIEHSNLSHLDELSPLRNSVSVPCVEVNGSQINFSKTTHGQQDGEVFSTKENESSPKFFSSISEANLGTVVIKEEVENENENLSFMCNGDRGFKGKSAAFASSERNKSSWLSGRDNKKSDKREPVPSIEKPDGVYEVRFKCHRCELYYDSEEKLHEHLMDHTGVKLCECRFCGKDFTKMTSLKRHLYYHVAGTIPQDCTRCGKSFSSFKDLKDHCANNKCVASAKAQFKCFRCRKNTSSLKKLKIHLLSQCNEEPVQYYLPKEGGDSCLPNTDSDDVSTKESDSVSEGPKDPSKDNLGLAKLSSRWVNQKFEIIIPKEDPDMQALNLESNDKEALQVLSELDDSDQGEEIWNLQCQSCGEKFETALQAKVHSKEECLAKSGSETSTEKETLKIKVVFEEDEDLQCSLTCSECDMKVVGVEKMLLHIKEHIYQRNSLTCPVLKCGKLFKDPKEFKLHLKGHTGHKPFKCADCGKRFFLRENYENHAQRHGILKNWSSLKSILGETFASGKAASAKSPITIESTIANLEAAEPDTDKKLRWTPHATSQPISEREEFKPSRSIKVEKVHKKSTANLPSVYRQANHAVYKSKPAILKPSPVVNKPVDRVPDKSVNRAPPPMIRTSLPIHRTGHPINLTVSRPHPPAIRTAPSIIRPIRPAPIISSPVSPVERPIHAAAGFLSLSAAFPVQQPRFAIASPGNSKTVFSVANVPSAKFGLSPKDSNARVHPPSYYRVSEHSKAHIQAANAELRKYPRSGRCEVCKKICSRLDKHMMVHLNQKPHLCPMCPQAFRQSEHLRRHIRARHEGNHRQFECPKCHKRLTRKDKLKEHMKNCIRLDGDVNINSPLSNYSDDSPVTLGDSLFDMIPGPHELNLQGHSVE